MKDQIYVIRSRRTRKPPPGRSRVQILEVLKSFRERRAEILRSRNVEDRLRVDLKAFRETKQSLTIGSADYIGAAPGVRVGDCFEARAELVLAAVHGRLQHGIDFAMFNRISLATCVVSKIGYRDKMNNSDYIVYGGEGGNLPDNQGKKRLVVLDQKMKSGNLALKNSMMARSDIRVVRGVKDPTKKAGSVIYVYDGLYKVVKYRRKNGDAGNIVFDFYLRRNPAQKSINWNNYK